MTTDKVDRINNIFADRIIEMIFGSNNLNYSFQKEGNKLGREIYAVSGSNGLFKVMNIVEQKIMDCEYSNEYLSDLRTLEWSWNNICEEWQA